MSLRGWLRFALRACLLFAAGWVLLVGFAFFLPVPTDWFPGIREDIRHMRTKDKGADEHLRHIILSSRQFTMGHEGGITVGYGSESWKKLQDQFTPDDLPALLRLYDKTPPQDDSLRLGLSWAIAAQCRNGLDFIMNPTHSAQIEALDLDDIISHILVLAQAENGGLCDTSLYEQTRALQNKRYEEELHRHD